MTLLRFKAWTGTSLSDVALGESKIKVSEYAPNYVKKIFAGKGHATKEEIEKMALQFQRPV